MSFNALLIHTCDIQEKTLSLSGYEQLPSWDEIAEDVPCRHDSKNDTSIADGTIRISTDDDLFFFKPETVIERGNRIVIDGVTYDVTKVNKLYGRSSLHHLEVTGRIVDNK